MLGAPATIRVLAADGLPFTVRVGLVAPDAPTDGARVLPRPDGLAAAGWSRDGEMTLAVEPGSYRVVVHRGPRFEAFVQTVEAVGGETVNVDAELPKAFEHPGWVLGDPHQHGSPSSDAAIPMEDRLIVAAAVGLQIHFGTDHDHLADYRPLLAPLGLDEVLRSVVADEVSPPLRGHFNIYPVEPAPGEPNNGAWTWWTGIPESTDAIVDALRERHGDDFVFQSNHPTDSGMGSSAGWSPGKVAKGDYWTDRLEAVEILNSGDHEEFVPFWFDLVDRGARVTPVGVSDSHGHFAGHVGWSATWFEVGDDPASVDDAAITDAIRHRAGWRRCGARSSGSTRSPARPWRPGRPRGRGPLGELGEGGPDPVVPRRGRGRAGRGEVRVVRPVARRRRAVRRGRGGRHADAAGDGRHPVGVRGPYRVDVGGDGWTPPLPPLTIE